MNNSSGYFTRLSQGSNSLFNSCGGSGATSNQNPNLVRSQMPAHFANNSGIWATAPSESWVDFGDGQRSLIDIDSIYPVETKTKIPDLH